MRDIEYSPRDIDKILNGTYSILANNRNSVLATRYMRNLPGFVVISFNFDNIMSYEDWMEYLYSDEFLQRAKKLGYKSSEAYIQSYMGDEYATIDDYLDNHEASFDDWYKDVYDKYVELLQQVQPYIDKLNRKLKTFKIEFNEWEYGGYYYVTGKSNANNSSNNNERDYINKILIRIAEKFNMDIEKDDL